MKYLEIFDGEIEKVHPFSVSFLIDEVVLRYESSIICLSACRFYVIRWK